MTLVSPQLRRNFATIRADNMRVSRALTKRRLMMTVVNTAATAVKPAPDAPPPKASRWPTGFFPAHFSSDDICAEYCQSIDDFLADRKTELVSKYGWR